MVARRWCLRFEREVEGGFDSVDQLDVDLVKHVAGDIPEVFFVTSRKDDLGDAGSVCGEHLPLDAADRKYEASKGDFSGHGHVALGPATGQGGYDGGDQGHSGRGSVFGNGTGGNMEMDRLALAILIQ